LDEKNFWLNENFYKNYLKSDKFLHLFSNKNKFCPPFLKI